MRSLLQALLLLVLALARPALAEERVAVVASFSILADMAAVIGGERVSVRTLVPPDGDAHVYQPTPADSRALAQAKLVVINGLGFEGWIDRLIAASGYRGLVVTASRGVSPLAGEHGAADPHAWQDARNGVLYVRAIADGLAEADPAGAGGYRARADVYAEQLAETDAWIRGELARIPPGRRRIITSHDAFGYFGRAYGVTFLAAQGVSSEYEPSAGDVAKLIRQIRGDKVKAVFVENLRDQRLIREIASETGAVVGGTVYSDALSPPGGPADGYLAMFRHNVTLFAAAMAGG
jgi:zinc/manganese transport system substrate-binding protein